jgi:glycosyltransferase involved in cell wall biosynthesis
MLNSKCVIAVSEGIKQDLLTHFNISPGAVKTIYNPIDIGMIRALSEKPNPYHGIRYIVHVGRMAHEKRHDVLLEAYKRSGLEHRLVLVGDGPQKQSILAKVKRLGISDRVILAGKLKNPYPIIKEADLLVLSSEYEGFGIVLTEALALHTMVVSTDCQSGPREIMSPRFTKYLAPVDDAAGLSQKMRQALADLENGVICIDDTVVERFAIAGISQQYLSLCK